MKVKITRKLIESTKVGEQEVILYDSEVAGLMLRLRPTGAKLWAARGRVKGTNKRPAISLGGFPIVSVERARDDAREILYHMSRGIDPRESEAVISEERSRTISKAVEKYLERHAAGRLAKQGGRIPAPRSIQTEKSDAAIVVAILGAETPVSQITKGTASRLRDSLADRLAGTGQRRAWGVIKRVFRREAELEHIEVSVFELLDTPAASPARQRTLSEAEIRAVWQAGDDLGDPTSRMIQFGLCLPLRRSLLLNLHSSDIDFEARELTIQASAEGNKAKVEFILPICDLGIEVLGKCHADGYLFGGASPASTSSHILKRVQAASKTTGWTVHDLRRTWRSHLDEKSTLVDQDAAGTLLQQKRIGLDAVYNTSHRRAALKNLSDAWNAILASVLSLDTKRVVAFR